MHACRKDTFELLRFRLGRDQRLRLADEVCDRPQRHECHSERHSSGKACSHHDEQQVSQALRSPCVYPHRGVQKEHGGGDPPCLPVRFGNRTRHLLTDEGQDQDDHDDGEELLQPEPFKETVHGVIDGMWGVGDVRLRHIPRSS